MDFTPLTYTELYGYFRLGLATGLVPLAEVFAWADRQVLLDPNPPHEVIELALSTRQPLSQVLWLLSSFHPGLDHTRSLELLLGRAGVLLQDAAVDVDGLAYDLCLLLHELQLPADLRAQLGELSVLRIAEQSDGALKAAVQRLVEPYREYESLTRSLSI